MSRLCVFHESIYHIGIAVLSLIVGMYLHYTYPDVIVIVDQLSGDISTILFPCHVVGYRALPVSIWAVGVCSGWCSVRHAGVRHYPGPLFYNEVREQTNTT